MNDPVKPLSYGDQQRLQDAATQARSARDFYRLEVRRAEDTLREKRAALQQAEDTYRDLDSKCETAAAPHLPSSEASA
jgi:hypothetical protein